ncbi:hypothetical protein MFIFM68171_10246 [Madurella fahalii]|uniref:Uncharacterized protein n=1 Tax=Madurella fahalii TaxID=1157608 RepID=A0ABQ0GQN1_9PEZI
MDLESITKKLTRCADGMFLWARLMISYLKCRALTPSKREIAISELDVPEGLEVMYERIFTQIAEAGKATLELAGKIFLWMLLSHRDLNSLELQDATISFTTEDMDEDSRDITDFLDTVITTCGGLVEQEMAAMRGGDSASVTLRFIHASVREYLSGSDTRELDRGPLFRGVLFLPSPSVANALLTRAASYWTIHLGGTELNTTSSKLAGVYTSLISVLNNLVTSPRAIMIWIEVCYIFRHAIRYGPLLSWSTELASSQLSLACITSLATSMRELGECLQKIAREWDYRLRVAPSCIWEEIGAFFPSKLGNPAMKVKPLLTLASSNTDISSEPINKISRLAHDGKRDVVLSVYPTRAFLGCYQDSQRREDIFSNDTYARGWVAKIEAFEGWERVLLYWLEFDDTGDHIYLVEQIRSSPIYVSVFDTQNPTRPFLVAQCLKWLRRLEAPYPSRDKKEFDVSNHPSESSKLRTDAPEASFERVADGDEAITYLAFTADGKSCVVNMKPLIRPLVFSVPESFLAASDWEDMHFHKAKEKAQPDAPTTPSENDKQALKAPDLGIFGSLLSHLPPVLSGNQQIEVHGEQLAEVTVANTGHAATLSLKATGSSAGGTVTLTRIPNRLGSSHVQPGVILPDTPDAPVRIVLDKGIETWNTLPHASSATNSRSDQFPLVVERSAQSFMMAFEESMQSESVKRTAAGKQVLERAAQEVFREIEDYVYLLDFEVMSGNIIPGGGRSGRAT